jgi:hypothetical protein
VVGDRLHGELFGIFTFGGTAEMRHQHHPAACLHGMLDGGHTGADAFIAGDLSVLDGHVEVFANQNTLSGEIEIGHLDNRHADVSCLMNVNSDRNVQAGQHRPTCTL